MPAPRLSSFAAETVECSRGADINPAVGDGGGREDFFVELVGGDQFLIASGFQHGDGATIGCDENFAVGGDGRGEVAVGNAAKARLFEKLAAGRVEGGKHAAVIDHVQHAVIQH